MQKLLAPPQIAKPFDQGIEAALKTGQLWASGLQEMSRTFAATTMAHYDLTMEAWKSMANASWLTDALTQQNTLMRAMFEQVATQVGSMAAPRGPAVSGPVTPGPTK
jgi:hypothetical protein